MLCFRSGDSKSMNGENGPPVTNEPVEYEKEHVEVQDFRKITDHCRGICKICFKSSKKNRKNHNM